MGVAVLVAGAIGDRRVTELVPGLRLELGEQLHALEQGHNATAAACVAGRVRAGSRLGMVPRPSQTGQACELVLIDPRGAAHFYQLMAQMRTSSLDESQLMFLTFDLLHQGGFDLRGLPLSERKRDLHRLCAKSRVPFMREVQTFPNGTLLFDHCNKFGFEGVVSKRLSSRYSSGPSRNWVKTKCPHWKRINSERHKIFEGPRKPELTEAQKTLAKKREELARVLERLRSAQLSHGMARELRKHVTILEREIAELEREALEGSAG